MTYIQKMGLIENVIGLDACYTDATLARLMRDFLNLVKQKLKTYDHSKHTEFVDFWLEKIGIIDAHGIIVDDLPANITAGNKKSAKSTSSGFSILDYILEKNLEADAKEILIEDYKLKLGLLFKKIADIDISSDENLVLRIKNLRSGHTDDEISKSFQKLFRQAQRRLKDTGFPEFLKEIEDNLSLVESDFVECVLK